MATIFAPPASPQQVQLTYTLPGSLTVGSNAAAALRPSADFIASSIFAEVKTAPTGASLIVTVKKDALTVGTVTIPAGQFTATQSSLSITSITADSKITVDVDQVGSTVPGNDLSVMLRGTR